MIFLAHFIHNHATGTAASAIPAIPTSLGSIFPFVQAENLAHSVIHLANSGHNTGQDHLRDVIVLGSLGQPTIDCAISQPNLAACVKGAQGTSFHRAFCAFSAAKSAVSEILLSTEANHSGITAFGNQNSFSCAFHIPSAIFSHHLTTADNVLGAKLTQLERRPQKTCLIGLVACLKSFLSSFLKDNFGFSTTFHLTLSCSSTSLGSSHLLIASCWYSLNFSCVIVSILLL